MSSAGRLDFVRSSFCSVGACVEVAIPEGNRVLVRDAKSIDGPVLTFDAEEWRAFIAGVRNGEFDL